jgi:hypothetical protein
MPAPAMIVLLKKSRLVDIESFPVYRFVRDEWDECELEFRKESKWQGAAGVLRS